MAITGLALLVGQHLGQRRCIGLRVVLDGDLRRHAPHRVRPAAMATADHIQAVRPHEMRRHRHLRAVRHHKFRPVAELLDEAENVIPTPAVQSRRMLPQFVQNLLGLERPQNRLDQHGGLDAATRYPQLVLGKHKDVIPQPRLQVAFQFGQIKIGTGPAVHQGPRVMEKVQAEIKQTSGQRPPIHPDMLFHQMPTPRPHHQRGNLFSQRIFLAFRTGEIDRPVDGVPQVGLPQQNIGPRG